MVNVLRAEILKEKRASSRRLVVVVPLVFTLFCFLFTFLMVDDNQSLSNFIAIVYNWIPLMLTPILISLLASAAVTREKKGRLTDFHRSLLVKPRQIWLAKIITTIGNFSVIYLAQLFLALVTEVGVLGKSDFLGKIALNALLLIVINVALIPLSMWLSELTTPFVVLMANFLMTWGTFGAASADYWWLSPWTYGFRTTAALLGIHPNGTFLPQDSALLNQDVLPLALGLSLVLLGLSTYLTTELYAKRVSGQ